MAQRHTSNRQQQGSGQRQGAQRQQRGERPWTLCLISTYQDRSGEQRSAFRRVGALFLTEQGSYAASQEGLHFSLERGDRLALFPPDDSSDHNGGE